MADLIIQPKNDDHLKLNNDAGTTILELANDESKLRLAQNNISASDGTTAITTSGANVTLAGSANNIGTASGTFSGSVTGSINQTATIVSSIDTFNVTKASVSATLSYVDCAASTDSFSSPVAGNVTVSNSNVLNFGTTGLYEFFYQIQYDDSDTANSLRFRIWATTDGTDPTTSSTLIYVDESSKDANTHHTQKGGFKLNINSTNIKIRPSIDTSSGTYNIQNASDFSLASLLVSYFQFTKIGANI